MKEQIKEYFMRKRKKIFLKVIIILAAIVFIIVDKKVETERKAAVQPEVVIGTKKDGEWVALNAEKITEVGIEGSLITEPGTIDEKADYAFMVSYIEECMKSGADNLVLSDMRSLSISKCNLYMISIDEASVINTAYGFLFSDGKPVGYVQFYLTGWELQQSVSMLSKSQSGVWYFEFLEEHKDKSFLLLTTSKGKVSKQYFLSEDNILYNPGTGSVVDDILIEGDCYGALSTEELCISYEKIINQIENIQ